LGWKEASHFLRNTGRKNVAIIDRHILRSLRFKDVKALNEKKYLEIEKKLEKIAGHSNLNLAELDLYLWRDQTGKVLK
jgi:N-glycosylase/DNA lyase